MPAQRVAGTAYFKLNGVQLTARGSLKADVSTVKREEVVNMDGTISIKETPKAGKFELDLETTPGMSVQALNGVTNTTVTFEGNNGTVYTLQGAFQIDDLNIDVDEGKVGVKFAGVPLELPAVS